MFNEPQSQLMFTRSGNKKKKYSVYTPSGKLVSFGDRSMEHYKDTALGLYSNQDHLDPVRRERYLKRAKGIKNKKGEVTWNNPESPNYYSVHFLW